MKASRTFLGMERIGNVFSILTDGPQIRIWFMTPELVRIRASFDGKFEEESYILTMTAWEDRFDEMYAGERERIEPIAPEVTETPEELSLSTGEITLKIRKEKFQMELCDREGTQLFRDVAGHAFEQDGNGRVTHYTEFDFGECFYGFGEKAGHLNKAKMSMRMNGRDAMAWDPVNGDPLYKHIPFYIRLNPKTHKALGLFYHNAYASTFDMGRDVKSLSRSCASFSADGGDIDLFLIAGNRMDRILDTYTRLTGRPVMLPKRALGYQGSGMLYSEQPQHCEQFIKSFVDTARGEGYPIDGFYLSSGYTAQQENKRCVFTWNTQRYEDPEGFIRRMDEDHVPVVPNIKPGVLLVHPLYEEMCEKEVFIRNAQETENEVGIWWGGDGVFWDFTKPAAREVWKEYMKKSLLDLGITSIWNDNCEYDGILDPDAVLDFDGKKSTVGALRPVLPNLMNRVVKEALNEQDPALRPYILSRGGFSGIQKYAQTWGGDTVTSWDTLKYNIATILGMSLSGVPNYGMDITGFTGETPDAELLVRWIQSGIFQPRFCIHSANVDFTVTEPWMYPSVNDLVRDAFKLRYQLLPYLYSAEYDAHLTGAPIMRPLIYDFQEDSRCCEEDVNYLFGPSLLVANVVEQGAQTKKVYLPAGSKWYDFETFRMYEGGQEIEIPVTLSSLPLFIREGGILPIARNEIMCMDTDTVTDLRLIISPKGKTSYTLYDDDGCTNDFENGGFHKTTFEVSQGVRTVVSVKKEGPYQDTVQRVQMEIISPQGAPIWISAGGEMLSRHFGSYTFEKCQSGWYFDPERRAILIRYENPAGDYEVIASWEMFNILGL